MLWPPLGLGINGWDLMMMGRRLRVDQVLLLNSPLQKLKMNMISLVRNWMERHVSRLLPWHVYRLAFPQVHHSFQDFTYYVPLSPLKVWIGVPKETMSCFGGCIVGSGPNQGDESTQPVADDSAMSFTAIFDRWCCANCHLDVILPRVTTRANVVINELVQTLPKSKLSWGDWLMKNLPPDSAGDNFDHEAYLYDMFMQDQGHVNTTSALNQIPCVFSSIELLIQIVLSFSVALCRTARYARWCWWWRWSRGYLVSGGCWGKMIQNSKSKPNDWIKKDSHHQKQDQSLFIMSSRTLTSFVFQLPILHTPPFNWKISQLQFRSEELLKQKTLPLDFWEDCFGFVSVGLQVCFNYLWSKPKNLPKMFSWFLFESLICTQGNCAKNSQEYGKTNEWRLWWYCFIVKFPACWPLDLPCQSMPSGSSVWCWWKCCCCSGVCEVLGLELGGAKWKGCIGSWGTSGDVCYNFLRFRIFYFVAF